MRLRFILCYKEKNWGGGGGGGSIFLTLGNVCSVHQEMFSTLGDTMSTLEGCLECIRGCSVHQRDIMIHVGGNHDYIGQCSVHRRDIMSTSGDIMIRVSCTEDPQMYS